MIRTCPKCRAFYADEALAFCLADGWPLVSVAPDSETWQDGVRALEEKTEASRKLRRKVRLRRVVVSGLTAMILAMVISKSYVVETTSAVTIPPVARVAYSSSRLPGTVPGEWPPEFLLASESPSPSPTSESSPTPDPSDPSDETTETSTSTSDPESTDRTDTDSSRPTDSSESSHSPTAVYSISGRVTASGQPVAGVKITLQGSTATTTTTDANGYYAFTNLRTGGNYIVIPPRDKTDLKPLSRSFDNLTYNGSADFNGIREPEITVKTTDETPEKKEKEKEKEKCTRDDVDRDRKTIVEMYSAQWRESIERERSKVISENAREGMKAEATLVLQEPQVIFVKECKAATVIYKYTWKIKAFDIPTHRVKDLNVPKQRIIGCGKFFGTWSCT